MSVYSWVMRSPYGRIFAEPTLPTTEQARHGDMWVSPVGLRVFLRTPGQVGNPGTGIWSAVGDSQFGPQAFTLANAATGSAAPAGVFYAGEFVLTAAGGAVTTFLVDSLSALIVGGGVPTTVNAIIIESSNAPTEAGGVTAVGSAAGTITFTFATPLPVGETARIAFLARL